MMRTKVQQERGQTRAAGDEQGGADCLRGGIEERKRKERERERGERSVRRFKFGLSHVNWTSVTRGHVAHGGRGVSPTTAVTRDSVTLYPLA
jgi:hypothetical protein